MAVEHETASAGGNWGRARSWKFWLLGMVLLLVLCAAVPAVLAVRWFVEGTLAAGKGAETPSVAVLLYFLRTPVGGALAGDEVEVNLFCDRHQDALHRQTLDLVKAAKRAEVPGRIAFDRVQEHPSAGEEAIDGDQAVYTTKASWNYTNINPARRPSEWMWWSSAYQDWTFQLVNANGWRVCGVVAPDPCDKASSIRCDPPLTVAPSGSPVRRD